VRGTKALYALLADDIAVRFTQELVQKKAAAHADFSMDPPD